MAIQRHALIVVRHEGTFKLGVPPVKREGRIVFSQPVTPVFKSESPLSPLNDGARYRVVGQPGRYWFGFGGNRYPHCIEVGEGADALEEATLNVHGDENAVRVHVKIRFDGSATRELYITRENLDDGRDFIADLKLSNGERFPLTTNEGTDIWVFDELQGSLVISVEEHPGGGLVKNQRTKGVGQVVGGEMADIEID